MGISRFLLRSEFPDLHIGDANVIAPLRGALRGFWGEAIHCHSSVTDFFATVQNISDKWKLRGVELGKQAINDSFF